MPKFKSLLMDESAVQRALMRIAHQITEKNKGIDGVCVVGIERRGRPLAEQIVKNLALIEGTTVPCGHLDIHFYRDDLTPDSENPVLRPTPLPFDVVGKKIVLVDDVMFTGRTARAAIEAVFAMGRPKEIQLAILVDRGHRELPIRADYVGKNIPTSSSELVKVHFPPVDEDTCVALYDW